MNKNGFGLGERLNVTDGRNIFFCLKIALTKIRNEARSYIY